MSGLMADGNAPSRMAMFLMPLERPTVNAGNRPSKMNIIVPTSCRLKINTTAIPSYAHDRTGGAY